MKILKSAQMMLLMVTAMLWALPAWAVDSYRYLHVSIDTPWSIFVFLFFLVFAPMILAVILYWRYALKKDHADDDDDA
ncbi:MAG: hypothetical protein Q9M16_06365 [Mariprofundus sp.]|nr:hypothetical protein [Mariprofundus sp.]